MENNEEQNIPLAEQFRNRVIIKTARIEKVEKHEFRIVYYHYFKYT